MSGVPKGSKRPPRNTPRSVESKRSKFPECHRRYTAFQRDYGEFHSPAVGCDARSDTGIAETLGAGDDHELDVTMSDDDDSAKRVAGLG